MAEGRMGAERVRARQMGALLAMFANAHRDPKKRGPFRVADFDPYAAGRRKMPQREPDDLTPLREAFEKRFG